ncbi:unnamed protein product [Effrenium voratum]|nr:unnamed protein product [Effrenium voratum]
MEDTQESERLRTHLREVETHLAQQLSFGELELALLDLRALERRLAAVAMGVEVLEALDSAMASEEVSEVNLDIEDGDAPEIFACAGDYLALFRHFALAEPLLRAGGDAFGVARCLAEEAAGAGEERQALELEALDMALHAELKAPGEAFAERENCKVLHLIENLAASSPLGTLEALLEKRGETPMGFLERLLPWLHTAAASAIESLARRLLAPAPWLPAVEIPGAALPSGVRTLLVRSQAFCHARLEALVGAWRTTCARQLEADQPTAAALASAAAIACHCLFVGYCIPGEGIQGDLSQPEASPGEDVGKAPEDMASWLLQAMYQAPSCDPPQSPAQAIWEVSELIRRSRQEPIEEASIAETLERLPGSAATPCEAFYDATMYPPWHSVECAGVLPAPLHEHLRRLCPSWCGEEVTSPRILVAGCGSGHQVAVELRSYEVCELVALDVSPKTVAVACRKLKQHLAPEEYARIRFLVGDIMDLTPGNPLVGNGFHLVICCGVLHHLPDPCAGLRRLSELLAPSGVLQLATYSSLSFQSWQPTVQAWLRDLPAAKGLSPNSRTPTQAEVREIRKQALKAYEERPEACQLLRHFPEFYTYAGVLDLLFHPLERTFTLVELLEGPITSARLRPLGVFFLDVNSDISARAKFRAGHGNAEAKMADLRCWHQLEVQDPEIFGRMHGVLLEGEGTEPQLKRARLEEKKTRSDARLCGEI